MKFTRCGELIEHTYGKTLVRYYLSSYILYYIHTKKASVTFAQNISKFKHTFLYTMHKFLGFLSIRTFLYFQN